MLYNKKHLLNAHNKSEGKIGSLEDPNMVIKDTKTGTFLTIPFQTYFLVP